MLEALSSEYLVIASATPPVTEVIEDGVNGLLVDFFDFQAVADSVDALLGHNDRIAAIRQKARNTTVQTDALEHCLREPATQSTQPVRRPRPAPGQQTGRA